MRSTHSGTISTSLPPNSKNYEVKLFGIGSYGWIIQGLLSNLTAANLKIRHLQYGVWIYKREKCAGVSVMAFYKLIQMNTDNNCPCYLHRYIFINLVPMSYL